MIGPQLQQAIKLALSAEPALAGGNVFDRVPGNSPFPRLTIGEEQVLDDSNACADAWEVFADVHVWSREPGFPEAKTLAAEVVARVKAIDTVTGFNLDDVSLVDTRALRDPDGLTAHIVVSFRFLLSEA